MNPKSESTSLNISIDPQTFYISTGAHQGSYAPSITVTVQNGSANKVYITEIAITLPDTLAPYISLGSITPVANPSKLWDFDPSYVTQGEFDATSVSGNAVPLKPNDVWQFSLLNVTLVSQIIQSSANVVAVVTFEDGTTQTQQLPVSIAPATESVTFMSHPASINPGQTSVLSWNCTGIDYVIIDQLGDKHWNPTDTTDVQPNDTITYTLYAYSSGVLLSAQQTITVGNPLINTFGEVNGSSSVNYGAMVNLTWSCNQFTKSITITDDTNVSIPDLLTNGNTVHNGTISVGPIVTPTTFVLTAFGNTREVFVQAEPTIFINNAYYTLNANPDDGTWELDQVTVSWNIASVASVELSPPIEGGPSMNNLVGSVNINPSESITYTLTVTGFEGNVFGQFSTPPLVLVVQKVSIAFFTQSPTQIVADYNPNECELDWFSYAQVATINNASVDPSSSMQLTAPDDGSVYTLVVGTFQNPNLVTLPLTIINSYGPYVFNSFQADPSYVTGLDLMISNASSMNYLLQGYAGGYEAILSGVNITTNPAPPSLATIANYETTSPSYFLVVPWPVEGDEPALTIAWADPNTPMGTITLQVLTGDEGNTEETRKQLKRSEDKQDQ